MARKKVVSLDADTTFKFETKGQELSGYYMGAKPVNTEMGPSLLHIFQNAAGNVGVWSSAQLKASLTQCVGMMTFITYKGKEKLSGGRTIKRFEVEYDDEDTIHVASAEADFRSPGEDASDEEPEALESQSEDDIPEFEDEAPAPRAPAPRVAAPAARPAAAPSAEARAKVQGLLNRPRK